MEGGKQEAGSGKRRMEDGKQEDGKRKAGTWRMETENG